MKKEIIGGVYFILNEETNLIKIGCSKNIHKRYSELQKEMFHLGYNISLKLIGYIKCEDFYRLERDIHRKHKKMKSLNEWYQIDINTALKIIENTDANKYKIENKFLKKMIAIYEFKDKIYKFIRYQAELGDIMALKLTITEKGIYYSLGELLTYPTNTVMINGDIPTFQELGNYVGLSDRNLRKYLYSLEDKNLLRLIKSGYKKAIVFNPEYYATGKDLDLDTLKLFNLVECDDKKIEDYI